MSKFCAAKKTNYSSNICFNIFFDIFACSCDPCRRQPEFRKTSLRQSKLKSTIQKKMHSTHFIESKSEPEQSTFSQLHTTSPSPVMYTSSSDSESENSVASDTFVDCGAVQPSSSDISSYTDEESSQSNSLDAVVYYQYVDVCADKYYESAPLLDARSQDVGDMSSVSLTSSDDSTSSTNSIHPLIYFCSLFCCYCYVSIMYHVLTKITFN